MTEIPLYELVLEQQAKLKSQVMQAILKFSADDQTRFFNDTIYINSEPDNDLVVTSIFQYTVSITDENDEDISFDMLLNDCDLETLCDILKALHLRNYTV